MLCYAIFQHWNQIVWILSILIPSILGISRLYQLCPQIISKFRLQDSYYSGLANHIPVGSVRGSNIVVRLEFPLWSAYNKSNMHCSAKCISAMVVDLWKWSSKIPACALTVLVSSQIQLGAQQKHLCRIETGSLLPTVQALVTTSGQLHLLHWMVSPLAACQSLLR